MSFPGIRTCSRLHTSKAGGSWLLGNDTLGTLLMSNGRRQLHAWCPDCGHKSSAIPHRYLTKQLEDYPVLQDNTGRFPVEVHRCEVVGCLSEDSQYHHWAPHSTFSRLLEPGEKPDGSFISYEEDLWPTSYLCQKHHTEWHSRMVGYRWNRRQKAS